MAIPSAHTAVVLTGPNKIEELQLPTPTPGQDEVLVKVAYGALIPPDTYQTDTGFMVAEYPIVLGYSISGEVVQVGSSVQDFKIGDRIAAFSFAAPLAKATREYVAVSYTVCAKIPDSLSFEQASTIPDNFVCAFYAIFNQLKISLPASFPAPTPPSTANVPILIYGAGSTAGQYAIQLLRLAGYANVVATASPRHHAYVKSLGAHTVIDYNSPSLDQEVAKAFGGNGKAKIVMDSITSNATLKIISKLVDEDGGLVGVLLPIKKGEGLFEQSQDDYDMAVPEGDANPLPKSVRIVGVRTFFYQTDEYLKENLMPKILPKLLADGLISPAQVVLMDQGSLKERVEAGLQQLRSGQVRGAKLVVKIIS